MNITVTGKGMNVSGYFTELAEKKAAKLERYFKPDTQMNIMLTTEKNRKIAEVTLNLYGVLLRAEESGEDMYICIDAALKKIERQIRKYRTKLSRNLHEKAFEAPQSIYEQEDENEEKPVLVRSKKFSVKPMNLEEATMQMELLGHSFFVFKNSEDGQVNVLYKRHDNTLGLIEPEFE